MQEDQKQKAMPWLYWSPGNNPRVLDIVDHLTPGERRRHRVFSLMAAGIFAIAITGISPLLLFLILNQRAHMPALIAFLATYVGLLCLALYGIQQLSDNFLHHSAWSKEQGWDKEPLPRNVRQK